MADKGTEGDRKKRVVVKKVAVDPGTDPDREPEPATPKKVQRKVVAKVPSNDPAAVRKVPPDQQPPQTVKKKVVPRPVAPNEAGKPVQVERVVVRQKPREPVPTSPDKLESGYNYLIEEPQPKRSFEFFKAKVGKGAKGLCISTSYPKKIIEEYGLHGTTVYWLSELEFDNQSLHPRRLDFEVTRAIQNFVKSNPSSVLIIDGVEFLILINGFERVMTFIKKMNDIMSATASTLITSINPSAFSEEKLSIIEREFDRVYKFVSS
ncbi:MAG: DUF835 domain-containing protein [Thermoplasmata archaeon]|nr:MAG: DUF835 domain-containing protein [Thermoplasmata archaeon]